MKFTRLFQAVFFVFIFAVSALSDVAQRPDGVITGRVVNEDGQPISHAILSISGVTGSLKQTTNNRETVGDDDGNFRADGLEPMPYLVSAWAPGYVPATQPSDARFVRVGDFVTVKLIRGGVITGRVTNSAGDPVIGVPVKAMRISDETGRSTTGDVGFAHLWTRMTDDRGVYRIYGLAPGSYLVAAGGSDASSARPTPFAGRTITYHPSSTREAATSLNVSSGVEATGIDIRYRGENGFAISGTIHSTNGTSSGTTPTSTEIFLRSPTTGETIDTTFSQSTNNRSGYAFYGVPNGEYEIIAKNNGVDRDNGFASTPRRVTVKGADVTGIDLTLVPNGTISGRVIVEVTDTKALQCQNHRESYREEIIVRARRDDPAEKREHLLPGFLGDGVGVPDNKGFFTISNLNPARYRIELELPDETWYLKAMTMTGSKPATDPRVGLTVKPDDKLRGLRLTIASGAAILKGKITSAINTKLPARSRVHLIPAETEAKDDVLRFAETGVQPDGAFNFTNLAPGKYFMLARVVPGSESDEKLPRPGTWDLAERNKLRREAEAANLTVDLKACQPITGYALPLQSKQ